MNGFIVIFEERILVSLEEKPCETSEENVLKKKRDSSSVVCLCLANGKFAIN